jgi:hypothetical protein
MPLRRYETLTGYEGDEGEGERSKRQDGSGAIPAP